MKKDIFDKCRNFLCKSWCSDRHCVRVHTTGWIGLEYDLSWCDRRKLFNKMCRDNKTFKSIVLKHAKGEEKNEKNEKKKMVRIKKRK